MHLTRRHDAATSLRPRGRARLAAFCVAVVALPMTAMTAVPAAFLPTASASNAAPQGMDGELRTANHVIPPMRERAKIMQRWWEWKLEHVLPAVMREQGIDLWIVRDDEGDRFFNNEGPVYTSLIPANYEGMTLPSRHVPDGSQRTPWFVAFHDTGEEIRYHEPRDHEDVARLVAEADAEVIAIGDHDNEEMLAALGEHADRAVSSWTLGVRWLETMSPEQIRVYKLVQSVANDLIAEGFSNRAIVPGVTTTDDLNWWFRHRMHELHLEYENHPSVGVQRKPADIERHDDPAEFFRGGRSRNGMTVTIQRGDIVSLDSDIMLLGLTTDSHQHAYVLAEGEDDVPEELREALRKVNRIQDLYRAEFRLGRTGKEIVAAADRIPREEGILESDLGFHPPPTFLRRYLLGGFMFVSKPWVAGMTSGPGYYPTSIVTNDHRLHPNTLYAFEPHTSIAVPGWGDLGVELGIGQIAVFTEEDGLRYLDRAQPGDGWHVIR